MNLFVDGKKMMKYYSYFLCISLTTLIDDCSLDMDSKATNRRRKETEMRRTFL